MPSASQSPTHLSRADAACHEAMHQRRVDQLLGDAFTRRRQGEKHPVVDFVFEYYATREARLRRWSPGHGVVVERARHEWPAAWRDGIGETDRGTQVDAARFPAHRRAALRWIHDLLEATQARKPFFGCHGLHEWAMVYASDDPRHAAEPMRLSRAEIDAVVESAPIRCTHYDAFRFFTPRARPLNRLQPDAESMVEHEQPGCLHTNMDVYRWAMKLHPWVSSRLVTDALALALRIRAVDMRASPYDLRALGYAPIPIESAEGRREYVEHQQVFAAEAFALRARLIDVVAALVERQPDAVADAGVTSASG